MRVLPDRLVALLFALAIALAVPTAPVAAQPAPAAEAAAPASDQPAPALTGLAGALAHFLEDDFGETDTGITEVAATGDPRAATIIEALQDGRLSFSAEQKKVFYKDAAGKLIDAADRRRRRSRRAGRPRRGAPQQPGAARARCRARRPEPAGARSRQALRGGAGGVQVARAERAAGARCRAREGNRSADQAGADRGARRRDPVIPTTPPRPTSSTPWA